MNIVSVNALLQRQEWQVIPADQKHNLLRRFNKQEVTYIILPAHGAQVPAGTLDAILRSTYEMGEINGWMMSVYRTKAINVILEKQSHALWGRIALPGMLVATYGPDVDAVTTGLRTLLGSLAERESPHGSRVVEAAQFTPVYDLTVVWDLIRQARTGNIAQEAGIDTELLGQFMAGSTFPCGEQAARLEASVRRLGEQLMRVAIR